jgi:hypothetical protein
MEADVSKHSETGDGLVGRGLPGTGGDFTPTDLDHDVEGHVYDSSPGEPGPDAPKPEGLRAIPSDDADGKDVEGHLFHMGPTTEGEFSPKGPGKNPHGDR